MYSDINENKGRQNINGFHKKLILTKANIMDYKISSSNACDRVIVFLKILIFILSK